MTADPYVKLAMYAGSQKIEKRKTSVKSQCLTPVYNESFAFTAPPKEKLQTEVNLVMTVSPVKLYTHKFLCLQLIK